jgi:hypothetical protein
MGKLSWAALGAVGVALVLSGACAGGTVEKKTSDDDDDGSGGNGASTSSSGGSADGGGGNSSVCGIDCGSIQTAPCTVSICNEQTMMCEIVNDEDGAPCDDGMFCTANDACVAGDCTPGPANDCGMSPPECNTVQCNEGTQSCALVPAANGQFCTPTDLCLVNATCVNGSCSGGMPKDCFFAPVPNECHVAVCNPANGQCEPEPNPQAAGLPCVDMSDLCTVGHVCDTMGNCQGGQPKDCSAFTMGCVVGTCDPMNGNCFGQPVMNGGLCDDLNDCTSGEVCTNGNCGGGVAIVQCVNADSCCPANCTPVNDSDCACTALAGPASFPNSISGWADAGLEIVALQSGQLSSFVFNNQGQADTITLRNAQNNQVVGTFNVPANSPLALTVNVNWNLQAGVTYRLTSAINNNGKWIDYTNWPTSNQYLQVNGTWGNNALQTLYWFTFTQLDFCP